MEVVQLAQPSRWPPRIAWILGVLCLFAGVGSWVDAAQRGAVSAAATVALERMDAQQHPELFKAARSDARVLAHRTTVGYRRTLGLLLAAVVLIVGGFFAAGLLRLHQRMSWAVRDLDDTGDDPWRHRDGAGGGH